jgi:Fuc2NAc and GlcNAc transferase
MVPEPLIYLFAGFVVTVLLELVVLALSRRLQLLAVPNARSSHVTPTPTLGGLAFVVTITGYLAWQSAAGLAAAVGLLIGGSLLALVGLRDDVSELGALPRLLCHIFAVAVVLYLLAPDWSWLITGLVAFAMVWHVNLFNFMDGIDGIAAAQLLLFCVGALIVSGGIPGWLGELVWLTAGAGVAFAAFNWPPARIFMGDVGSGFLGLLLGFLVVALSEAGFVPFIASLILLTGFWFDASYTLCVRMFSGQNFASAHRSHLYQILAAQRGHRWTTLLFSAFGLLWLIPLAVVAARVVEQPLDQPLQATGLLLLAAAPMAFAAVKYRAGVALEQR